MPKRILIAAGVLVVAAGIACLLATRGPMVNAAAKPGQIVWKHYTGASVCFSPASDSGLVYFGSEPVNRVQVLMRFFRSKTYFQAVDAGTGKRKWRVKVGGRATGAPLVREGTVYFGTWEGDFHALDIRTGEEKWRFDVPQSIAIQSSPVSAVDGKAVVFACRDGYVYSLDAKTGNQLLRYPARQDLWSGVAAGGSIVFGGNMGGRVFAVDLVTGKEKWGVATGKGIVNSTPLVAGDTLFVGSGDGCLYALDPVTGAEKWRFQTAGPVRTSPRLVEGTLFFGSSDNYIYAVDAASAKEKWKFMARDAAGSSPAVADGVVYFGCEGGDFYAVDSVTGKELWSLNVGRPIKSDPVIAGDVVCFGDWSQNVYAVRIEKRDAVADQARK